MILDSRDCSSFERCGGEPDGKWNIAYACWDIPQQPGRVIFSEPECLSSVLGRHDEISGSYEFSNGAMELNAAVTLVTELEAEAQCVRALTGSAISNESCESIASMLTDSQRRTTCVFESAFCRCTVATQQELLEYASSYSVEGSFIVVDGGSTIQFCRNGAGMTLISDSEQGRLYAVLTRQE